MVQIADQPYQKTYTFSFFSYTFFLRYALLIGAVMGSFFIVYKTGNFYQSSHFVVSSPTITPIYQYFITLETSTHTLDFTNIYTHPSQKAIDIKFLEQKTGLTVKIQYPKYLTQKVKSAQIFLIFNFLKNGNNNFGMIKTKVQGFDLSEATATGWLKIQQGTGVNSILSSNNILLTNQYDFQRTFSDLFKSSAYLSYMYNSLPIDRPTDLFQFTISINYMSYMTEQNTPSILGQLVWSWVQYFPIFFFLYWMSDQFMAFLFKEGLIKRGIVHDKDYLTICKQQQDKISQFRRF